MRADLTRAFRLFRPISPQRARSSWHATNSSTTLTDVPPVADLHDRLAALAVASERVARQAHTLSHAEHGFSQPGHHRPHSTVLPSGEPPVRTDMAAPSPWAQNIREEVPSEQPTLWIIPTGDSHASPSSQPRRPITRAKEATSE